MPASGEVGLFVRDDGIRFTFLEKKLITFMVRTCFWPLNHQKQNKTKQPPSLHEGLSCAPVVFNLHPSTCAAGGHGTARVGG